MLDDPFNQFSLWFEEAKKSCVEPEAMALATSTLCGIPAVRMVLLKGFSPEGFLFFTNSDSRKGKNLKENPLAAVTLYWRELYRQVIIEGHVSEISNLDSDAYFESRPRLSQLSAWASHQGAKIDSREILLEKLAFYAEKFNEKAIPRPPYWNGYQISPLRIEFWQGKDGRLHDRYSYHREKNRWIVEQISP